jgi:hypothetical protein
MGVVLKGVSVKMSSGIRVTFISEKVTPLPISLRFKKSFMCLTGRTFKQTLVVKNNSNEIYPKENLQLIIEIKIHYLGEGENAFELHSPNHLHIGILKPSEERKLLFYARFKKSGTYEVSASVTEYELFEFNGKVDYTKKHAIVVTADNMICAGDGWEARFKYTGKPPKYCNKIINCYTKTELIMIFGSVAAIIAAIFSALTFLYTLP